MVSVADLESLFPDYLLKPSKLNLASRLEAFPHDPHYYASTTYGGPNPLQGDVWQGLTTLDFQSGVYQNVAGIILSNSCDIDVNNPSLRSRKVLFAPITRVSVYESLLRNGGSASNEQVCSHLDDVRKQEITSIFYLPCSAASPERIALLDDVSAQPLENFLRTPQPHRKLLLRLNNYGFYIFLMKLTIHFSRFGERLDRGD